MATPYSVIYDAFTSKMLEDEWYNWDEYSVEADQRQLLESAIPYFKFPRCSFERDEIGFFETLDSATVQILATYMKIMWLDRCVLTWKNLKPLYSEQDFSQANLIDKFTKLLAEERTHARELESIYYRSIDGKPFMYRTLAGDSYV